MPEPDEHSPQPPFWKRAPSSRAPPPAPDGLAQRRGGGRGARPALASDQPGCGQSSVRGDRRLGCGPPRKSGRDQGPARRGHPSTKVGETSCIAKGARGSGQHFSSSLAGRATLRSTHSSTTCESVLTLRTRVEKMRAASAECIARPRPRRREI